MIYLAGAVAGAAAIGAAGGWLYPPRLSDENAIKTVTKTMTTKSLTIGNPSESILNNKYSEAGKSLVSVVQGSGQENEIPDMVSRSVDLLGGLDKIDVKGRNVLVKPNTNSNNPHPASTNPLVVSTVVQMLIEAGASEVQVGDSSNLNNRTRDVMRDQGIQEAVEDAGGKLIYLEELEFETVTIQGGKWLTETQISKPVIEAERLINLPIIKSHNTTGFSMSMKNFVGVIHKESRFDPEWKPSTKVFHACGNPSEAVADLNLLVQPDLTIMDGTKSLVSYGESDDSGEVRNTNLIVASGDRIANDIVGISIIKDYGLWPEIKDKDVWEHGQIRRALELGLGRNKDGIKILGQSLENQGDIDNLLNTIYNYTGIPKS
jgi:uncharacterized protein (DUF362 family)